MQAVLPDVPSEAVSALRGLPAAVVAQLCAAFADEVAERIPRLLGAATTTDPDLLTQAVRDAHTLSSSAWVVGEREAAHLARTVESVLLAGDDLAQLGPLVHALDRALARWRPSP